MTEDKDILESVGAANTSETPTAETAEPLTSEPDEMSFKSAHDRLVRAYEEGAA